MIKINLLPVRETKKQARLRVQAVMLGVAAAVGVVISIAMHSFVVSQTAEKRAQIQLANLELKKLEVTRKEVEKYRAEEEAIAKKLQVIDQLEKSRFANVKVMLEMSERVPERMWITDLSLKNGELGIKGVSIDAEIVAQFLSSLEAGSAFRDVELDETSLKDVDGLKLNTFKVHARFGS